MNVYHIRTTNIMNEHSFHLEGIYEEREGVGVAKLQQNHRTQFYLK